jgi:hypothetical protein
MAVHAADADHADAGIAMGTHVDISALCSRFIAPIGSFASY